MPKLHPSVFVAEGAHIIGDVEIEKNSSVWFNAVIRGDVNFIRIGERTNIQDASGTSRHAQTVSVDYWVKRYCGAQRCRSCRNGA